MKFPYGSAKSIAKWMMTYTLSYDISSVCIFHRLALVALLNGCTVGTTWGLLSLLRDARGLNSKSGMWSQSYTQCCKLSSARVLNLVLRLLICEVLAGCARWRLGRFVFIDQQNAGYESNCMNSSIYIPSSRLHLHDLLLQYWTHRQHPEPSRQHVTCIKSHLLFQNIPYNLHHFVRSLWASFRYVQLYHNANTLHVDSFSTSSDGSKGQPQRKGEGNC